MLNIARFQLHFRVGQPELITPRVDIKRTFEDGARAGEFVLEAFTCQERWIRIRRLYIALRPLPPSWRIGATLFWKYSYRIEHSKSRK